MTIKEKLYLKTDNILKREVNLPYILKKIHEIEKLKIEAPKQAFQFKSPEIWQRP